MRFIESDCEKNFVELGPRLCKFDMCVLGQRYVVTMTHVFVGFLHSATIFVTGVRKPASKYRRVLGTVSSIVGRDHVTEERRGGGAVERRSGGAVELRSGGAEEWCSGGAVERRSGGAVELWSCGPEERWRGGAVELWS